MKAIPDSMKAVVLTGHGDLDKLEYRDCPIPSVADDEVLIEKSFDVRNIEVV